MSVVNEMHSFFSQVYKRIRTKKFGYLFFLDLLFFFVVYLLSENINPIMETFLEGSSSRWVSAAIVIGYFLLLILGYSLIKYATILLALGKSVHTISNWNQGKKFYGVTLVLTFTFAIVLLGLHLPVVLLVKSDAQFMFSQIIKGSFLLLTYYMLNIIHIRIITGKKPKFRLTKKNEKQETQKKVMHPKEIMQSVFTKESLFLLIHWVLLLVGFSLFSVLVGYILRGFPKLATHLPFVQMYNVGSVIVMFVVVMYGISSGKIFFTQGYIPVDKHKRKSISQKQKDKKKQKDVRKK